MNYDKIFDQAIDRLHSEGRYRVFIDILRNKGAYPNARCFAGHNGPKPITVWCSNDYLAMGQHPKVIAAMEEALHDVGAGSGGTLSFQQGLEARRHRGIIGGVRGIPQQPAQVVRRQQAHGYLPSGGGGTRFSCQRPLPPE